MEKVSCIDRVRNEEVMHRARKGRNLVHEIKRRKALCNGHMLCRNCLLKQVVEGNKERRI